MSIATAITNAQQKVANAYTAVSGKGGTLPATQDLSNLPTAINSIPTGGGGGSTVDVKAVGVTTSYVEDDKVILIPTDNLYDTTVYSYDTTVSHSSSTRYTYKPLNGCILDYSKALGIFGTRSITSGYIQLLWSSDKASVTGSWTPTGATVTYISPEYKSGNHWAVRADAGYEHVSESTNDIGTYLDGVFTTIVSNPVKSSSDVIFLGDFCASQGRVYNLKAGTTFYKTGQDTPYQFPVKYNNNWYVAVCGRYEQGIYAFNDSSTRVYPFTGWDYYSNSNYDKHMQFVDDNVDYILACPNTTNMWEFYKIDKNNTSWTATNLTDVTAELTRCFNTFGSSNTRDDAIINCKDFGEYVEMFVSGLYWGYNESGGGNKVGHYRFYKATDTLEKLPDVFMDIDGYNYAGPLSVNWELGLISIGLTNYQSSTAKYDLYVKKFDEISKVYPYYAYENLKDYYYSDSITGFVKSNKGVDALGNTILEVECTEDPNHSWNPPQVIIGMEVTVNEGEPE